MRNRAWALSQMVKKKQSVEEVEAMRESLVHEGWTVRDDLPTGWRAKAGKHTTMDFMTPVGKWFPSLSRARALMETFGECNFDFSRLKNNLLQMKRLNISQENLATKSSCQQEAGTENPTQPLKEISSEDLEKTEEMEKTASKKAWF